MCRWPENFACNYEEEAGCYLYFKAVGKRIEIKSATATKDTNVPVICFKKSRVMSTRLACSKLTNQLLQCMEEGEEVWLAIYSEFKPSKQNPWKLNPQNALQGQEA